MLVNVHLHGALKEAHPEAIQLEATTYRSLLNALKLRKGLDPRHNPNRFLCTIEGVKTITDLDTPIKTEDVHLHCEAKIKKSEIHGSGNNPYVRIIIGVVLLVVGYYLYTAGGAAYEFAGMLLGGLGASLVFGGLLQLLNPPPEAEKDEKNKSLTGYENTVKSGTPIPIILGEHLHGGHIISLNVETLEGKDLKIATFLYNADALATTSWTLLSDGTNGENINSPPAGDRTTMPPEDMPPEDLPPDYQQ